MTLSGYQRQSELYRSERSIIEHGVLRGRPVVVKRLNRPYPLPRDLADYQQEYDILQHIESDWVIKGYELHTQHHALMLVLEDMGGQSLRSLYQDQALPLDQFLRIAIAITQGLGHIHAADVIHKDINPANIIFNPDTQQLRIIDFGLSSRIGQETAALEHPNALEGTLTYLSPEQTGRVNRLIDYRTDIYSLGATFYELLTGCLPFTTTDPMALVHSHLAKMPPSITQFRSDVPEFLAAVIAKMIAKSAEERYQSAWGIQADLERLQGQRPLELTAAIAQDDYPFQFRLPQTLYGRQTELSQLLTCFEESRQAAGARLVLVTGYSGIGKSSLVRELYRPITEVQGYFASGKFDQLQRAVPYAALIKAFSGLLRQLLGESAQQLDRLRSQLVNAVGNNGQVIIDVIPDLALVIGAQPAVPKLAPAEAQNRFSNVFQRFVRVFAHPQHPLVLFLDDLQWADTASLNLLQLLLSDSQTESLLVIGAYRNNEVSGTHPLMRTLAALPDNVSPTTLTLAPLGLGHICQFLSDTFYRDLQTVEPLAQLVLKKTGGNPFFVNEFLKTLEAEALIRFDLPQRRWQWNLAQIQAQGITDNVVVLMTSKLRKLPPEVQQLLSTAACIGNSFDEEILGLVTGAAHSRQSLEPALRSGLLLASKQTQDLRFLHDRVQQAAYELVSPEEKATLHLRIGQHLQQQLATQPDKLFEVVDHLNLGRPQLPQDQWLPVAQLNLEAGQRAKQATAYQAAEQYLAAGVGYLRGHLRAESPADLSYSLHREWAEVQYLLGEFAAAQATIDALLQQTLSPLQQAEVYSLRIVQNTIQTNYQAALEAGKEALAVLGVTLPLTNLETAFQQGYADLQAALGNRPLASLENLPEMTAPDKMFAVELLSNLGSAAYRYDRRVWQVIVVLSINLFLDYGNVPQSCYGYSNYGTLLGSVLGDYQAGYESALVSLRLSERYCDRTQTSRACFILSNFVQSWVRPVADADAVNQAGVDAGLETGEFQYVGYTLSYRISNLFFQGKPLTEVMAALQEAMAFCRQVKNQWAIDALLGYRLTIDQLSNLEESPLAADDYIQACHDNNSLSGLCRYYILQGLALYLDRQPVAALAMVETAAPMLDFILGVVTVADYHFYTALLLAELPKFPNALERLEQHRQWLHQRAALCPENFLQKAQLIDAELARLQGQRWEALQHYDAAIASAVAHQFLQDEAIACERAAFFWLDYDKEAFAQPYLQQAHYAFMRWGAAYKVTQLEAEFPWLQSINDMELNPAAITKRISGNTFSDTLDLSSLLKASQTISSQIVLEQLTRELMEILVENAGAQRGYLLLKDAGALAIEAYSGNCDYPIATDVGAPDQLPLSLINYVIRTEKTVVLGNAAATGDFIQDPYIRAQQPKSILCVPLLHQGSLTGLVYLEHFLAPNAFTRDRLEVIHLLSSQAAISIQNAQLYNTLEQKVAQRTQALAAERAKSERLLRNILPVSIADRLKENEQAIADGFDEVTVLFCDIVGFTPLSSQISPKELVVFLNQIFSVFDQLCDRHQLEKIKTIGDAYIAVGGLPGSAADHGAAIANMALDMLQALQSFSYPGPRILQPLQVRIGIHMGPVVAGVIGTKKFAYDLWGDTVNVASRMESQGKPGKIQVTSTVYEKLVHRYRFEPRGAIQVKGKGHIVTYWLCGKQ